MLQRLGRRRSPVHSTYDPRATTDDISACFRLLLGRNPNREEWRGHAMRAGEELSGVVASYLTSLEFARRGLLTPDHMRDVSLSELPEFSIYTDAADAAVGHAVRRNDYEREVSAVFRRVLQPGMGMIDLGANIGYFAMLSAALVGPSGFVLAVEPNPRNARMLEASRRVNGFAQVTVSQTAAGEQTGLLVLHSSYSNGTTSDLPDDVNLVLGAETVPCVRAEALVPAGRRIDLIKADVEGAEYKALSGCRQFIEQCQPVIVSEFSPDLMPGISGIDGPGYLRWLAGFGYGIAVIEPDGGLTEAADAAAVMAAYQARGTDHIDIVARMR